ncbi:hypothetical protein K461DRAFT_264869 [Myriangium duriaei CBS 260.36]|uniref:GYF domain-containing protein n=1 Tax=Myriangium duriaei CBS 260.36 TaxID=1168546 RepID=A0A9P4MKB9_9PEZI|nr:hypothetical protein K461DRAFT_264869 [Myriangium duriaei CBS 260.36]
MSFNPARQKRTAESSARFGDGKKPRFDYRNPSTLAPDAPEEDAILDLDEIGRSGQHTKRNAVNLDGFESDSSTEDLHERSAGRRRKNDGDTKAKGSKDEEEMDMFAEVDEDAAGGGGGEGDEEDYGREGKRKGKEVRFLDVNDIEGQVASSKSGGHVSSDLLRSDKGKAAARDADVESSSESGGDEERDALDPEVEDAEELGAGSKKHHAPKLDAFNMRSEAEEGRFDDSGNYVRKAADPDAVHDGWLEGLSKRDMRRAREAQEKRDQDRRQRDAADDAVLTSDLLATLIRHLARGETVLEALARLGGAKKKKEKKIPKWKSKKLAAKNGVEGMDVDEVSANVAAEDPAEIRRREAVDAITGAADALFTREQPEIYDQERELLQRQFKRETGEDWVDEKPAEDENGADGTSAGISWEYRWSDARDGGENHGPYDGPTMKAWNEAGYFGEAVEFRRVGESDWNRSVDFV